MGMYYEDAEVLARMIGYVEPEKEEDDYDDWYENYIEEKLQSFTIIKSLHEARNLPRPIPQLKMLRIQKLRHLPLRKTKESK